MLCYVRACRLCTLVLLHFFLDFVWSWAFFCIQFFVFQFATVNKLCYWFSLLTGMCTIFTILQYNLLHMHNRMASFKFNYQLIFCPCCCVMIWLTLFLYVCSSIRYVRILICCHKELLKSSLWSNSGRPLVTGTVWPSSLSVKYRKHHATLRPVYRDVILYSSVQIPL